MEQSSFESEDVYIYSIFIGVHWKALIKLKDYIISKRNLEWNRSLKRWWFF